MRILLTLFVLFFSSLVVAEDISDFQIEGMSIGDSLLDYLSEEEIIKQEVDYFPNKDGKFTISAFNKSFFSNTYDWIEIGYKSFDNKFVIQRLSGVVSYEKNIDECYDKKFSIYQEISNEFNFNEDEWQEHKYTSKKNTYIETFKYVLSSGDSILVQCYDWATEMENTYFDHLKIIMITKEYEIWVNN